MVELRIKVGSKGQVLIPKILRDKYGIEEGRSVTMEPTAEGLLIRGRPSRSETMARLRDHVEKVRGVGVRGPNLGDLRRVYLEMEFEERGGREA